MLAEMQSDPFFPLLLAALFILVVGMVVGAYADHMRRKYQPLEEAERDAAREIERNAQYGVTLPIPDIPHQLG